MPGAVAYALRRSVAAPIERTVNWPGIVASVVIVIPSRAGAVINAIPLLVVFLVANRQIIQGVQFSGLKM